MDRFVRLGNSDKSREGGARLPSIPDRMHLSYDTLWILQSTIIMVLKNAYPFASQMASASLALLVTVSLGHGQDLGGHL